MGNERVEVWGRKLMRPRITALRVAQPHPFAVWNRYGEIPGTSYCGVTIGFALMLRGRGIGIRWAKPTVTFEYVENIHG